MSKDSKFNDGGFVEGKIRVFKSGASRNSDEGKLDYFGFFSPIALRSYAEYMHRHRFLEDGTMRESDNWKKGIPNTELLKSLYRHFMDVVLLYSGFRGVATQDKKEALHGVLFNTFGLLHNLLLKEEAEQVLYGDEVG